MISIDTSVKKFKSKRPQYEYLRKKWTARHKNSTQNLIDKHLRKAAFGSLSGLMLMSSAAPLLGAGHLLESQTKIEAVDDKNALLKTELIDKVPDEVRSLNQDEETKIADVISKDLGFKVKAELDGKRLNRTYGVIGGEQHLYRYPGDTLFSHAQTAQDWAMYGSSGIAPGLGAWGYFAPSKEEFSKEDEMRERYYLAVQTFMAPGFAERVGEYRDFFKFRKMIVVNPKTGQAVVACIGDAGPAVWTGKHLGGSPEVMHELGLARGPRKGPVLYFFIDDPENKVPLGPIKIADDEQFIRS
jgi:hypothetical protein